MTKTIELAIKSVKVHKYNKRILEKLLQEYEGVQLVLKLEAYSDILDRQLTAYSDRLLEERWQTVN